VVLWINVMFASLMLLLSMGMDFMKSKNQHSLEQQ